MTLLNAVIEGLSLSESTTVFCQILGQFFLLLKSDGIFAFF